MIGQDQEDKEEELYNEQDENLEDYSEQELQNMRKDIIKKIERLRKEDN